MTEVHGLRVILGTTGTVHSISEPPSRDQYDSDEQYEAAYEEWYATVTYWKSSITPIEEGDA